MNKYQEALDFLLNISKEQYRYFTYDKSNELLQELVEKATPKEGVLVYNNFGDRTLCCPNCKKTIVNVWSKAEYKPNYCPYCGQALDWSKEDEN